MKKIKIIAAFLFLFPLSFCATQINAQTDSTANQDELISPTNMEASGITAFLSGSSIYLEKAIIAGVRMGQQIITTGKDKVSMTIFFDPKTVAMKIDFAEQVKRTIDFANSGTFSGDGGLGYGEPVSGIVITTTPIGKVKQGPMYFDNNGFVYTGTKKDGYIKVPFEKLSKLMPGQGFLSEVTGMPDINYPDGSITYYGMDVSPKKFPILEWVFVYKTDVFEGNDDFTKDVLPCIGDSSCVKYTLRTGADAGSYVLFDSKKRLREINTKNDGYIIYSYQEVTVKLPPAKDMSAYF